MKIAIPCVDELLCMHFGHCQQFAFVEVNDDQTIAGIEMIAPPPHEPGLYPKWVKENGGDIVIAGGMGMRAQELFTAQGISVLTGAPALEPRQIAMAYLAQSLETGENACDH